MQLDLASHGTPANSFAPSFSLRMNVAAEELRWLASKYDGEGDSPSQLALGLLELATWIQGTFVSESDSING